MAYRIGICDDEQNIVLNIIGYVEHYFQLQGEDVEIHTWNSGEELISVKYLRVVMNLIYCFWILSCPT